MRIGYDRSSIDLTETVPLGPGAYICKVHQLVIDEEATFPKAQFVCDVYDPQTKKPLKVADMADKENLWRHTYEWSINSFEKSGTVDERRIERMLRAFEGSNKGFALDLAADIEPQLAGKWVGLALRTASYVSRTTGKVVGKLEVSRVMTCQDVIAGKCDPKALEERMGKGVAEARAAAAAQAAPAPAAPAAPAAPTPAAPPVTGIYDEDIPF